MQNQQYAFIQLGEKQYALKSGESIGKILLLKISPNTISYRINGQIFQASIEKEDMPK